MKTSGLVTILLFITIAPIYAGGSFCLDTELLPLLNERPELKKLLFDSFDLHWTGGASRIGNNVNERFGGRRLGPYYLHAKPKGLKGDYIFTLVFHTKYRFKDENFKDTVLQKAHHIPEELISVEVVPGTNGMCAAQIQNKSF